jgi:hypothetical protein
MERAQSSSPREPALRTVAALLPHDADSVAHLLGRARLLDSFGRNHEARRAFTTYFSATDSTKRG